MNLDFQLNTFCCFMLYVIVEYFFTVTFDDSKSCTTYQIEKSSILFKKFWKTIYFQALFDLRLFHVSWFHTGTWHVFLFEIVEYSRSTSLLLDTFLEKGSWYFLAVLN